MFSLPPGPFPSTPDALAAAIEQTLATVFAFADHHVAASIRASEFPRSAERVDIKLDHCSVKSSDLPRKPQPAGSPQDKLFVRQLSASAWPLEFSGGSIFARADASDVTLAVGRDTFDRSLILLADVGNLTSTVEIKRDDLQSLATAVARAAAKTQGLTIREVRVDLASDEPRSLKFNVEINARKLMLSGVVLLEGRLTIHDSLIVSTSGLRCTGKGVIGSMAASFIQPRLAAFNNRDIPLIRSEAVTLTLHEQSFDTSNGFKSTVRLGRAKA